MKLNFQYFALLPVIIEICQKENTVILVCILTNRCQYLPDSVTLYTIKIFYFICSDRLIVLSKVQMSKGVCA